MRIEKFNKNEKEENNLVLESLESLVEFKRKTIENIIKSYRENEVLIYESPLSIRKEEDELEIHFKVREEVINQLKEKYVVGTYNLYKKDLYYFLTITKTEFEELCKLLFLDKQIVKTNLENLNKLFNLKVHFKNPIKQVLKNTFNKKYKEEEDKKIRFLKIKKIDYKDFSMSLLKNIEILKDNPSLILDYISRIEIEELNTLDILNKEYINLF